MKYHIKVIPGAKKIEIINMGKDLFNMDLIKVKLTARPVEGDANIQLTEVLCDYFGKRKYEIKIISGLTGRDKIVEIKD